MRNVTRRTVLGGAAVASLALTPVAIAAAVDTDPVVALVREYLAVDAEGRRLNDEVMRMEREFIAVHGRPRVLRGHAYNPDTGERRPLYAHCDIEIDQLLMTSNERRAQLKAELRRAEAEWKAKYEAAGISAVSRREDEFNGRADDLLNRIFATPATTLAGVAAKVAVLDEWTPSDDDNWVGRHLVDSLKGDLARMA